jgi:hypothetical protein
METAEERVGTAMEQMDLFSLSPAPSQSAARTAFEKTSERLREAEERFIASGALEGKDVWKYWSALRMVGFCYEGYTIEEDGSRIYAYSDPEIRRPYTIHVLRWDGTPLGLEANALKQDAMWRRILAKHGI